MAAANNTLLTPDQITREALRILHEKLSFVRSINRQYDDSFAQKGAKIGDTLRIRMPVQYNVTDGATFARQDSIEQNISLSVTRRKHVGMGFTSNDLTMDIDNFSKRFIEPAMSRLAAEVETDAIASASKLTYNQVGSAGSVPNSLKTYLLGRAKLNQFLAPKDKRTQMVSSIQSAEIVDALKALFNDQSEVSKQYKEGLMGRTAGADWVESESIYTHVNGTGTVTNAVDATVAVDGTDQLALKSLGNAGTVTVGTVLTIAGVFAVHPETKVTRNAVLQQFVVTAVPGAADSTGDLTVTVSPKMYYGSTPRKNISAAPQADAEVKFVGVASTGYEQGLLFQEDAFTFATADLELPQAAGFKSRQTYDGLSLRLVGDYNITDDESLYRIDILYGFGALRPEHACRVTS